jgi:cytochrome oxidase Cu insertion factor (SCO1/SenC/PrrC family)
VAALQPKLAAIGSAVQTLSITVDAIGDTPAVLRAYAAKYGADTSRWTFARAESDAATESVCTAFAQGVELPRRKPDGSVNPIELAHVKRLGLIDKHARLRGMYETDDAGLSALVQDAAKLANEP